MFHKHKGLNYGSKSPAATRKQSEAWLLPLYSAGWAKWDNIHSKYEPLLEKDSMTPETREGRWQDLLQRRESFRTVIHWRHWATRPERSASSMPIPKEVWGFIWSQPHHCPGETLHQLVTAQALLGIDLTSWVVLQVRFPHLIQAAQMSLLQINFLTTSAKKSSSSPPSLNPAPYFPRFFYHGLTFYYILNVCLFHMKT